MAGRSLRLRFRKGRGELQVDVTQRSDDWKDLSSVLMDLGTPGGRIIPHSYSSLGDVARLLEDRLASLEKLFEHHQG